jgi:cell division protein FtsQ
VEKYDIFKIYPSSLYINIQKTKFLAKINRDGINYIIGSNGKLSYSEAYNENLPFIFGKPKIEEFLRFKEVIDISKIEYKEIKNLYYFGTGRWDLELKDNLIIKLPENDIKNSLELVFEFLNNENFSNIKEIDARIKDQIILND